MIRSSSAIVSRSQSKPRARALLTPGSPRRGPPCRRDDRQARRDRRGERGIRVRAITTLAPAVISPTQRSAGRATVGCVRPRPAAGAGRELFDAAPRAPERPLDPLAILATDSLLLLPGFSFRTFPRSVRTERDYLVEPLDRGDEALATRPLLGTLDPLGELGVRPTRGVGLPATLSPRLLDLGESTVVFRLGHVAQPHTGCQPAQLRVLGAGQFGLDPRPAWASP